MGGWGGGDATCASKEYVWGIGTVALRRLARFANFLVSGVKSLVSPFSFAVWLMVSLTLP